MEELISVIVPVYNVENYLSKCLTSLVNQNYQNIEIIVVDDGSTDNSLDIAQSFEKNDYRVHVFSKCNGGLSDARNYGMLRSRGTYFCFVDSDDYVSLDYIQTLYDLVNVNHCDIGMVSSLKFSFSVSNTSKFTNNYHVCTPSEAVRLMLLRKSFSHSAWGKIYHRNLWLNEKFPVGKLYEDYLTTYKIFSNCKTAVAYSYDKKYYYLQRPNSIMGSKCNKNIVKLVNVTNIVTPLIIKKWPELYIEANELRVVTCLKCLQNILTSESSAYSFTIKKIKVILKKHSLSLFLSKKVSYKTKTKILLYFMGKFIFTKFYNMFSK